MCGTESTSKSIDLQPFEIRVEDADIRDLRERLARTRWPDEIAGADWAYGADLSYLKELAEYWRKTFDWRAQEAEINSFANYRANVDGVGIHFIHERGKGPNPMPLVITHGWPGSFAEMLKIIPLLTDPGANGGDPDDSFDVVIPSMPGFGFSDRSTTPGMHTSRIADLWQQLMTGLGYQRYGAQGGDFGAGVATWLGLRFPEHLIGIHLNYIPGSYKPFLDDASRPLSAAEIAFEESATKWTWEEGAYLLAQMTKPQNLAYGLNDSPVGLAAWIVEKFYAWGDCGGDVERRFSKDELLTNISIYWFTETMNSSNRLYYEGRKKPLHFAKGERVNVPCGVAKFAKEEPFPPRELVERGYNLQRWTEFPTGGHFAALEEPELLVDDIRAFFRPLRGKNG